jgi:hypothetical protein
MKMSARMCTAVADICCSGEGSPLSVGGWGYGLAIWPRTHEGMAPYISQCPNAQQLLELRLQLSDAFPAED